MTTKLLKLSLFFFLLTLVSYLMYHGYTTGHNMARLSQINVELKQLDEIIIRNGKTGEEKKITDPDTLKSIISSMQFIGLAYNDIQTTSEGYSECYVLSLDTFDLTIYNSTTAFLNNKQYHFYDTNQYMKFQNIISKYK